MSTEAQSMSEQGLRPNDSRDIDFQTLLEGAQTYEEYLQRVTNKFRRIKITTEKYIFYLRTIRL